MDATAREEGFHVEQHFGVNVRSGWEETRTNKPVAKRHLSLAIALDPGKQLDVLLQSSGVYGEEEKETRTWRVHRNRDNSRTKAAEENNNEIDRGRVHEHHRASLGDSTFASAHKGDLCFSRNEHDNLYVTRLSCYGMIDWLKIPRRKRVSPLRFHSSHNSESQSTRHLGIAIGSLSG